MYRPGDIGPKAEPIVDLQVYPVNKPNPSMKHPYLKELQKIDPALFVPAYTPNPFVPPQWSWTNQLMNPAQFPIIKNYSINMSGPSDDHLQISRLFEDILPAKQFNSTSNTLGERLTIYDFIRSVFIKQGDGEDIDIAGNGKNSLLNYLKFLELNPYHTNALTDNPYISLPRDMLIYRSCYPIRYDRTYQQVQCAPNSLGMNIRIYKLTMAEYYVNQEKDKNYNDFDVWREVAYYEYIREEILKKKICPNFVMMYAYYIVENCNIDFDKIKRLGRMGKNESNLKPPFITVFEKKLQKQQLEPVTNMLEKLYNKVDDKDAYSGRGLLALTESPLYNLYSWSSKTYAVDGNIRKMINPGYHKADIWYSILFQMMAALYTLQIFNIAFRDFTVKDNIYIKDISTSEHMTTYWKYSIDGVDYYIPNYGYLTMIDSNFKDVKNGDNTIMKDNRVRHKIYSNIFTKDKPGYNKESLEKYIFQMFVNAINPNEFTTAFTNMGGVKPPEEIITLMNKIYTEANKGKPCTDIGHYILTYMCQFVHNRVGTLTKELEIKNISIDDRTAFHKGEMVAYECQTKTYLFVIFLNTGENGKATVLTKEPGQTNIIQQTVSIDSLFHYSKYEPIVQNYKPNEANLAEEDLLETYTITPEG